MAMRLVFQVVSVPSTCLCPSLVWLRVLPSGMCISQPRWIPAWIFLRGWQGILWAGGPSLLVAPPEFSMLVFHSSAGFLIATSCCETTQASPYYYAWQKWAGGLGQRFPQSRKYLFFFPSFQSGLLEEGTPVCSLTSHWDGSLHHLWMDLLIPLRRGRVVNLPCETLACNEQCCSTSC